MLVYEKWNKFKNEFRESNCDFSIDKLIEFILCNDFKTTIEKQAIGISDSDLYIVTCKNPSDNSDYRRFHNIVPMSVSKLKLALRRRKIEDLKLIE
jgi:hypothetical protein